MASANLPEMAKKFSDKWENSQNYYRRGTMQDYGWDDDACKWLTLEYTDDVKHMMHHVLRLLITKCWMAVQACITSKKDSASDTTNKHKLQWTTLFRQSIISRKLTEIMFDYRAEYACSDCNRVKNWPLHSDTKDKER